MSTNPHLPQQYHPQPPSDSTDTIAMIIEIVFGLFGLLGLGWLYVGNFVLSIAILIGYWVLLAIEGVIIAFSGGLCGCLFLPLNIVLIVVSGIKVRDYVRRTGASGSILYVIVALALALLLLCVIGGIVIFAVGGLAALSDQLNNF